MDKVSKLIQQIISAPERAGIEFLAHELLNAYYDGADIESLRLLLESSNEEAVAFGTWIASELGTISAPLSGVLSRLLTHRSKEVRFSALDCLLAWGSSEKGYELSEGIALLDDEEEAVRWKTLGFLSNATREQLETAANYIESIKPESRYIEGLRFLLKGSTTSEEEIIFLIESDKPRIRKFGVAAAARIATDDSTPLKVAASSDDCEVAQFARDKLKILSIP